MYKIIFSPSARKSLGKIPKDYQIKIKGLIRRLSEDPFLFDLKKLSPKFAATHRLRYGSYRLFLHIDTETKVIMIAEITRRTTQTYR